MIVATEPYPDYWYESEEWVKGRWIEQVTQLAERGQAADVGCGEGRLLGWLNNYFETVDGVEPDAIRAERSAQLVADNPDITVNTRLPDGTDLYDAVVCSHVVQHITPQHAKVTLTQIRKRMREGGLLYLTTSHSTTGEEEFVASVTTDGGYMEAGWTRQRLQN